MFVAKHCYMPKETRKANNMAEPLTTDWPVLASAKPVPNANFNPNPNPNLHPEATSQDELQEQATSPSFQTTLPGPVGNQLDTEMMDIAVSYSPYT
jgi:hypothetical protein